MKYLQYSPQLVLHIGDRLMCIWMFSQISPQVEAKINLVKLHTERIQHSRATEATFPIDLQADVYLKLKTF